MANDDETRKSRSFFLFQLTSLGGGLERRSIATVLGKL